MSFNGNQIKQISKTRMPFKAVRRSVLAGLLLAACLLTSAQQTNAPTSTDYSAFKIIADRNIFNPNRLPQRSGRLSPRRAARADTFSLIGTMTYQKGTFAFFDGSSSDFRKILQLDGEIAGYKVKDISYGSTQLEAGGKQVVLKVGSSMRREGDGSWQPAEGVEQAPAPAVEDADATTTTLPPPSANEGNDILKKLMQQREQELK